MALLNGLIEIASAHVPTLDSLIFLLITILPAYHLIFRPIYCNWNAHLSALPGPKLTILTPHYVTLLDAFLLRTRTLFKWHEKYGPIVRIGPNEVSFTSPTAVKQIYQDPTMEKDVRLYGLFTHFGATNAFSSRTNMEHGWRRKGVAAMLSWSKVLEKEVADRHISQIVGRYLKLIENGGDGVKEDPGTEKGGKMVDIYLLNNWFATDVVTGYIFGSKRGTRTLCFGEELGTGHNWWQVADYHRRMVREHYASTLRAHTYLYVEFPWIMWIVDRVIKVVDVTKQKLLVILGTVESLADWERDVVGRRIVDWGWKTWMELKSEHLRGEENDCVGRTLVGLVEKGQAEKHGMGWTDEIAASELMDQMLAGMDTTSDTLSFLIYHLSHPSSYYIQKQLHTELITKFPFSSPMSELPLFLFHPQPAECSYSGDKYMEFLQAISSLPYLDGVVKETLRLYTAIPGTLPRVIPSINGKGKVIDGVYLSPGTVVGSLAYAIHRDSEIFGDAVFNPERWIAERTIHEKYTNRDTEMVKSANQERLVKSVKNSSVDRVSVEDKGVQSVRQRENRLWAFGSGGRGCVGKHLATLEIKLLVATIYWRYQTQIIINDRAKAFGRLEHRHWEHRKTFRDVLPFKGVNGIISFIPYA